MDYKFTGRSAENHLVELEIFRRSDYPGHLTHPGPMDILNLLSEAVMKCFEIRTDYDTFCLSDFEAAFKAFPNLETLRMNVEGNALDEVLELLAHNHAHSGDVLCPNLKTLIIGDLDNRWSYDLDHIIEILAVRAGRGSLLDHFEIHLMHETEENHEVASVDYVPRLQELVGEVVYGNHVYVEYDWERDMEL